MRNLFLCGNIGPGLTQSSLSNRYFVVAVTVGYVWQRLPQARNQLTPTLPSDDPQFIAQTGNFTIVTDDSEPEYYTYSFAHPHNLSPSQTDTDSTSATTTSRSGRPSLSYNSAQGRTRWRPSWLFSVCMFGLIVVA